MNEKQLLEYLQRIMLLMVERIEELDLSRSDAADTLIREFRDLLQQVGVTLEEAIPPMIAESYFGGVEEATAMMAAASTGAGAAAGAAAVGAAERPFRKQMHRAAVEAILDDTLLDFQAALRTAALNADRTITDTLAEVRDQFAKGLIHGDGRKKMTKHVAETFAKRGMTAFVTRDGRKLPLDFYAMTVTRTKIRMANVAGASARYEEMGQDLVQIRGNGDSCATCARYRNLVMSLHGQTEGFPVANQGHFLLPPFHPNCRCTVFPYVLSRKEAKEIQEARERVANFDPEEDPRTPLQRRQYEEEQRKRRIANQEKKTYANWVAIFGERAPANIGAFRRMKRSNSKRYQALYAEYNRTMRGGP